MGQKEKRFFTLCSYTPEGKRTVTHILNKTKMLVGHYPESDLCLVDKFISYYHAIIMVEQDGCRVVDLNSLNGIYLNGKKVTEAFFGDGDTVRFGKTELHVEETYAMESMVDQDSTEKVEPIEDKDEESYIPELPPSEGAVIIDNEYCNIIFNENKYKPFTEMPLTRKMDFAEYVDFTEQKELKNIVREVHGESIEISVYSCGHLLHLEHYSTKNQVIYLHGKKEGDNIFTLETLDESRPMPFVRIGKDNQITVFPIPRYNAMNLNTKKNYYPDEKSFPLGAKDVLSFSYQTVQVLVRVIDTPPRLKKVALINQDKAFQKEVGKSFSILMSIMLLLLFVNVE
ncbi:MAG: FHA domain-containing protein, partial [Pseudomonadota bacterium]